MIKISLIQDLLNKKGSVRQNNETRHTLPSGAVRVPIRWKITLPYMILAMVIAFGAVQVITNVVFDTVDERFASQLIEAGKLSSGGMVNEESRLLEGLRLMAYSQGIIQIIQEQNAEKLRELLFPIVVNNDLEMVEILDTNGYLFLSMRRSKGSQFLEYQFAKGGDNSFSGAPFIQNVLQSVQDERGDKFAGMIQVGKESVFYVSGPIIDNSDHLIGVILVGSRVNTLALKLREKTLTQISFYDKTGKTISSTFSEPSDLSSDLVSSILESQDTQSPRRDLQLKRDITTSEMDYAEILGPWEVRSKAPDLGLIGSGLVKSFFVKTTQTTRFQISILAGAILLLILMVGVNLATLITRPLLKLVQASKEVTHGNLEVHVSSHTRDEIDVLTQSFNQMVASLLQSKRDLESAYDSTLEGWSKALEYRDKETKGHSDRVTSLTMALAKELDFDPTQLIHIRRGALLHDIGKMGIPDSILLKEGPLTPEERVYMQRHSQYGFDLLHPIEYLRPAISIPYGHHEKWDGTGYPNGLKGEEIPLEARLFALIDVWDALTSDRPYRKAMSVTDALKIIQKDSGTHFDPRLVEIFIKYMNSEPNQKGV